MKSRRSNHDNTLKINVENPSALMLTTVDDGGFRHIFPNTVGYVVVQLAEASDVDDVIVSLDCIIPAEDFAASLSLTVQRLVNSILANDNGNDETAPE